MDIHLNVYQEKMLVDYYDRLKNRVKEIENNDDMEYQIRKSELVGFKLALACMGILKEDLETIRR